MSSGPSSSRSTTFRRRARSPTEPSSGPGPPGGGSVVAAQLLKLAGACDFYTALGEDDAGRRSLEQLEQLGLAVHAQWFGSTRRALTHVDQDKERTITTVGPKLRPKGPFDLAGYDTVFFIAGDATALRSARAASFLAATPRELETLQGGRSPPRPARRKRNRPRRALRRKPRCRRLLRHRGRARRDSER